MKMCIQKLEKIGFFRSYFSVGKRKECLLDNSKCLLNKKKRLKNITKPAVIGLLLLVPGRCCLLGESRGYNDF